MNQQKLTINIKKLNPEAIIPTLGSKHSAGFDFYSSENTTLYPKETIKIHTGIAMQIPEGKALFIWDRSGLGSKGYHRHAGLIDSDYRGEILIAIHNTTTKNFEIKKGDRIAQGVIQDYYKPEFIEVEELQETERGEGSFGSTGR